MWIERMFRTSIGAQLTDLRYITQEIASWLDISRPNGPTESKTPPRVSPGLPPALVSHPYFFPLSLLCVPAPWLFFLSRVARLGCLNRATYDAKALICVCDAFRVVTL